LAGSRWKPGNCSVGNTTLDSLGGPGRPRVRRLLPKEQLDWKTVIKLYEKP